MADNDCFVLPDGSVVTQLDFTPTNATDACVFAQTNGLFQVCTGKTAELSADEVSALSTVLGIQIASGTLIASDQPLNDVVTNAQTTTLLYVTLTDGTNALYDGTTSLGTGGTCGDD